MIERLVLDALVALALATLYALAAPRYGPDVHRWRSARHARRLSARLGRGSDRYFEELRELQLATPQPYVAHGFGWHFVRALALLLIVLGLPDLLNSIDGVTIPTGGAA